MYSFLIRVLPYSYSVPSLITSSYKDSTLATLPGSPVLVYTIFFSYSTPVLHSSVFILSSSQSFPSFLPSNPSPSCIHLPLTCSFLALFNFILFFSCLFCVRLYPSLSIPILPFSPAKSPTSFPATTFFSLLSYRISSSPVISRRTSLSTIQFSRD